MAGNTVDVHINGDESVSGAIAEVLAALEALNDKKITVEVDADTKAAQAQIAALKKSGKDVKINVDVDTAGAQAKLAALLSQLDS